jgi:hypothetical protein
MGRNAELDDSKQRRLEWRTNNVLIGPKHVTCITFDQLYDALKEKFDLLTAAAKVVSQVVKPGLPLPPKKPKGKGK